MKKTTTVLAALFLSCCGIQAQGGKSASMTFQRPRLVVGIVIDQMRWDYLYRYQQRYTEGGFKRLLTEGYSCENTRLPYIPSVTAIGHTCIYTGSVPTIHGIAGNNFYKDGKKVYCTDDPSVRPVGTTAKSAQMSPCNLWVTTIGDEMKLATNGRSRVVGVSLKDRASILPAGQNPDGAFWFDDQTGNFVTSSYYMDKLPEWVVNFNKEKHAAKYLSSRWQTLYPEDSYTESTADATDYEDGIKPGEKALLPLDLPALYKKYGYETIRRTPFGNSLTFDMARAAIKGEHLGEDNETDLLAVSCSSTDYIGHQVGTNAIETEDTYLRLDRDLASFLNYLDKNVGKGNYLLFLTADHGAMNNARYLQDRRIPAGSWSGDEAADSLNKRLSEAFATDAKLVREVMNYQVYFDTDKIRELHLDYSSIKQCAVEALLSDSRILYACDMEKTTVSPLPDDVKRRTINGYCHGRSGDVQIVLKSGFYAHGMKGTDHGTWSPYDTHIPLLFMGWNISHGSTTRETEMTDIAATVAALLHVQAPNGCVGKPIF